MGKIFGGRGIEESNFIINFHGFVFIYFVVEGDFEILIDISQ